MTEPFSVILPHGTLGIAPAQITSKPVEQPVILEKSRVDTGPFEYDGTGLLIAVKKLKAMGLHHDFYSPASALFKAQTKKPPLYARAWMHRH
ncbi:MAG TPA: hypothetical protein PKD21_01375 [Candidatus Competibacter phosphatis]|nr:hypothetical protein [Candidatus Competibacter phosphatis]